ncbi:MAG: MoaD/ThiS family protein [Pyrinomonadaceae bacterium]|nr:MoaD/ThiS family protein [Pyrinomonadaceae bacterium]
MYLDVAIEVAPCAEARLGDEKSKDKVQSTDNCMVTFNIAGFLADFTNGRSEISVNSAPTTVGEALHELWELHIGLRDRVVNEQGHLRTHVNIFVDGENIRRKELLDTRLSGKTEITILPSVSGGNHS